MRTRSLLLIALLTALRCTTAAHDLREPALAGEREEKEARPGTNEPLERRIEQMNHGASTTGLRVRIDWIRSGAMTTAEVYGNGAGIYDDRIAFALGRRT